MITESYGGSAAGAGATIALVLRSNGQMGECDLLVPSMPMRRQAYITSEMQWTSEMCCCWRLRSCYTASSKQLAQ